MQIDYSLNDEDHIEPVSDSPLPDIALLPHIEWMIRHYFQNTKQLI